VGERRRGQKPCLQRQGYDSLTVNCKSSSVGGLEQKMARRRRLKKKEIKEDRLVTVALGVSNYVQEHFAQVVAGVVVLLAAVAVILFTAQARRNSARAAEQELAVAMNIYQVGNTSEAGTSFANVADRYSQHDPGVIALYFLGECQLAQSRYQEAVQAYDRYLDKAGEKGQFSDAALMGQAYCYEGLKDYPQAAAVMEKLSQTMDPQDARYLEVLYSAGAFYEESGAREKALDFFRRLSELATGELKGRADVRVALLE